jgi:hypothetical protein
VHRIVAKVHHRRLRPVRVAAVVAPKRCVTLHSERLNSADIAYGGAPVAALDAPAAISGPDATPDFGLGGGDSGFGGGGGGGGGAFPNPGGGGVGGGSVTTGSGNGPGPVSAAPEPQTWMLMILGVGLCGAALRRARRTAATV